MLLVLLPHWGVSQLTAEKTDESFTEHAIKQYRNREQTFMFAADFKRIAILICGTPPSPWAAASQQFGAFDDLVGAFFLNTNTVI